MSSGPIRVLHVIGNLGLGGAQICVKYIVENTPPDFENYICPLRSKPSNIHVDGEIFKLPYRNYDPRKFLALVKLCRKYNIDILHAHLPKPIIGCLLATFFCKAKVVIHEHGPVFRRRAAFPGYRLLLRILKKRAEVFIAVSKATAEKLQKTFNIPSNQIQVVYNAVDTVAFDPEKYAANEVRQSLGIDGDVTVLGYVGRLSDQKGVDLIIRVLPLLRGQSNKYLLLIAGEGPRRRSLERLACELGVEKNVRFLGFCQNVPQVISSFDIGLVPSRFEPFGMTAIELMRMRIPIVTSGVNGLGEFITNGQTGIIPANNNPTEIADAIIQLHSDSALQKSIVALAYSESEQFSVSRYIEQMYGIYTRLMESQ